MQSTIKAPPRLAAHHFKWDDSADRNRVFLWENHDSFPMLRPVSGWAIVGVGKAPWPGTTEGYAVMFEKVAQAEEETGSMFQKRHLTLPEGTRIWQHGEPRWVPGTPEYNRIAERAAARSAK